MNEDQVEGTGYSLSQAPPAPPERRTDERYVSLLRVGAITAQGRRELCLIRNISAGGMMIRAYSPFPVGTPVCIEFKQGDPVEGMIHWIENGLSGVRFEQPIDVVSLLASETSGPLPRMPRIELSCAAWVRQEARVLRVTALNVSQGGLCVRSAATFDLGRDAVVTLPGMAPVPAVVKWGKQDCFGLGFNTPLPLDALVAWLKHRQDQACERLAG